MDITIDKDICIGAGMCVLTVPNVFTQDDEGFSTVLPGGAQAARDPRVREAARVCPVRAITVGTHAEGRRVS